MLSLTVNVEVPIFMVLFAMYFTDSIKTNFIIFKTCYVTLGYDEVKCALLGTENASNETANLEKIVEPYATVINMMNTLTEGLCSTVVCLFAGPWSDRFGRKPILIIPLIGYVLSYLLTALFSLLTNASPWYSVLCIIPNCLGGGISTVIAAGLCYVTDSTSNEKRGMRMGIIDAAIFLAIFLGTFSSSYVLRATNYATVFTLAGTCCALGLVFTIFRIPESLTNRDTQYQVNKLFQLSNINDMVKTTFKKRENFTRYTILCCIIITALSATVSFGQSSVMFLFLREKFFWSLKKYTLYSAASSIFGAFGILSSLYVLHKMLKIPETILILVSLLSSLNGSVLMGLANSNWTIYFVPVAKWLDGIFGPMVRSLVSKIIPNEEVGKVFSLFTVFQFFFGIVGSPLYTFIYNKTIDTDVGFFNFVSGSIFIFELFIVSAVIIVRTRYINKDLYVTLINEEVGERQETDDEIMV